MTARPCNLCRLYDHLLYRRTDDARRALVAAGHNAALTTASERADESLAQLQAAQRRHVNRDHPDAGGEAA